ncbi:MAG TPA: metal-dependent hydrolase [Pyrinomonadaceae bacterium]|nr:metal-dependent hydrolase [Pyrinomonadaceae bacterium]
MPTVFTHAAAAVAAGKVYARGEMPARFWLLSALCAVLPDADVLGFAFRIRYGDLLGHRGLSHSLAFAAALGVLVASLFFRDARVLSRRWWSLAAYFAAVTASHGLLDALTDGGLGVAFFAPFDDGRYFFPWRPIEVSPIGAGFFSRRGLAVLASEFVWVWLPSLLIVAAVRGWRKLSENGRDGGQGKVSNS